MVNVTVVKGMDVVKYLVRITVAIILIFILARFFYRLKETKVTTEIKEERNTTLISCLEETIPQAKRVRQDELRNEEEDEPVKTVLTKELGIMRAITKKDVIVQKLTNEESSISLDEIESSETENNQPEDIRKSSAS